MNLRTEAFRALAEYVHGQMIGRGPLLAREVSLLCGVPTLRVRKVMESYSEFFSPSTETPTRWVARTAAVVGEVEAAVGDGSSKHLTAVSNHIVSRAWFRVNLNRGLNRRLNQVGPMKFGVSVEEFLDDLRQRDIDTSQAVESHLVLQVAQHRYVDVEVLVAEAIVGDWRSVPEACKVDGVEESRIATFARELDMLSLRSRGATLEEIGRLHGLTRERVRQCMKDHADSIESYLTEVIERDQQEIRERIAAVLAENPGIAKSVLIARVGASWRDIWSAVPARWLKFIGAEVRSPKLRWSESQILAALQVAAGFESPLSQKTFDGLVAGGVIDCCSTVRIAQIFGKWSRACEMAGVEPVRSWIDEYQRNWSEEDCINWLCRFLLSYETSRSTEAYGNWAKREGGHAPSSGTIRGVVGPWSSAINRALVELRSDRHSGQYRSQIERELEHGCDGMPVTPFDHTLLPSASFGEEASSDDWGIRGNEWT